MTMGMGCRPVPSLRTMTHVFGTSLERTAQSTGIRIMHANYFSKEFALELLRNPKRKFRVRWWEENMSSAEVEIKPRIWLPLEVMDPEARGLCVDEWILLLERRHIARNPNADAIRNRARDKIDALVRDRIAMRRKVSRRTLATEQDIHRVEEKLLRFFVTPTTAISSEQTHDLYGVRVGDLPAVDEDGTVAPISTPPKQTKIADPSDENNATSRRPPPTTPGRRRRTTSWTPGMKE